LIETSFEVPETGRSGYCSLGRVAMSSYNGRRVPNFSQFLEDLNTIPSPYDQAIQDQALQQQDDSFNIDAELALFTNAEFLDFDDMSIPLTYEPLEEEASQNVVEAKNANTEADYLDLLTSESDTPSITSSARVLLPLLLPRRDLSFYDTIEIRAFPSWQPPSSSGVRISSSYLIHMICITCRLDVLIDSVS
jgi:hypothetical protein